ncbi:MAG: SDR family oxidoreductase [Oscillospiraceae bacterium]|nr:SDR family oxidoreductase [Oscillospiraceae bacterium]
MLLDYGKINYAKLLDGYNALVTGGASGIGKATALLYARHGAAVAIADIDTAGGKAAEAELKAISPGSFFIEADMGDAASIDAMAAKVIERFPSIQVLVNNAGICEEGWLLEMGIDALERMFKVNVMGTIRCTQQILPAIMADGGGNIVNISSDYALRGCPGVSMYAATKGAVLSFTRSVAYEFSRYDIRANCILPGMSIASRGDAHIEKYGEEAAALDFSYFQPIKRRGLPEDVANAALYLGSQLSRFLNGEALEVNGGGYARAHKQSSRPDESFKPF